MAEFLLGASWRHPRGPGSSIKGLEDHPAVHIAYQDAEAYANWAGKTLPSEAEWEFAAKGGLEGKPYAWGSELAPQGRMMANHSQGAFPWQNLALDGYEGTSPVGRFPPNGYGLLDTIGDVWEWTDDWCSDRPSLMPEGGCCIRANPRRGLGDGSFDPCMPHIRIGRKVLKGGSHLCAPNYRQRYRPAAPYAQQIDSSSSHVGFQCVVRTQQTLCAACRKRGEGW